MRPAWRRRVAAALACGLCACAGAADDTAGGNTLRADQGLPDAIVVPGADTGPVCGDADGDGYTTCAGDCDDSSPFVQPGARELCDGVDNNCDGAVDEGFAELGSPCSDGFGACATTGEIVCDASALGVTCGAKARAPSEETCDGQDEDCDGSADEGVAACCTPGQEQVCGVAVGECRQGVSRCSDQQVFGPCEGGRGPAEAERCNGKDDDCDGRTDEDLAGVGERCQTGRPGLCAAGLTQCDGTDIVCVPLASPPAEGETCNGVDDDCDGETDEGLRNGMGECCAGAVERCNGVDDDCDGTADEGTATPDRVCVTARGTFDGRVQDGHLGHAVALVPDLNDDDYVDVLVGAPGPLEASDVGGTLYVISGADGTLIRQIASPAADGEFGFSLATADFDGDGVVEWIVGAPDGQSDRNHHGRVVIIDAATHEPVGVLNGSASGSRFGEAVAAGPLSAVGPTLLAVGQPNLASAAGRVAVYGLEFNAATGMFERDLRFDLQGAAGREYVGEGVALGPPDDFGDRRFLVSHVSDSTSDTELLALNVADQTYESAIESPRVSGQTFGQAIGTSPDVNLLAVGAWGVETGQNTFGAAWLMHPDGEVVDSVVGADEEAHLGLSVAVATGLRARSDITWCAGAVTSALVSELGMPRPGYVLCRSETGAAVATVAGDEDGDGFGWSMALSTTPDPDGGYLLAVGAPMASSITRAGGRLHLFRLVPE